MLVIVFGCGAQKMSNNCGYDVLMVGRAMVLENVGATMLISSIVAQYLSRRFSLDLTQSGGLMMILNVLLMRMDEAYTAYGSNIGGWIFGAAYTWDTWGHYVLGLLFSCVIIGVGFYHGMWTKRWRMIHKSGFTVNVYLKTDIDVFVEYLNKHPNMAPVPESMQHGDPRLIAEAYVQSVQTTIVAGAHYAPSSYTTTSMDEIRQRAAFVKPQDDVRIPFVDGNFAVKGSFVWRSSIQDVQRPDDKTTHVFLPYIELWIERGSEKLPRPCDYLPAIRKWLAEQAKTTLTLHCARVFNDGNGGSHSRSVKIYDGPILSYDVLEKQFMDTFFQKDKDRIWNLLKLMDRHPEQVYKLGQFPQLGFLLHGPPGTGKSTFAYRAARALNRHIMCVNIQSLPDREALHCILRTPHINGRVYTPKEVVFVFDEFDRTVKVLANRHSLNRRILDTWATEVSKLDVKVIEATDEQRNKTSGAMRFNSLNRDGEDEIQLHDLLEALQGVVPSEGAICIATTNAYDELKTICPALFRNGRLTPVHFDHFDLQLINQFSQFHFGQTLSLPAATSNQVPASDAVMKESVAINSAPISISSEATTSEAKTPAINHSPSQSSAGTDGKRSKKSKSKGSKKSPPDLAENSTVSPRFCPSQIVEFLCESKSLQKKDRRLDHRLVVPDTSTDDKVFTASVETKLQPSPGKDQASEPLQLSMQEQFEYFQARVCQYLKSAGSSPSNRDSPTSNGL
jgi:hypothetical protein